MLAQASSNAVLESMGDERSCGPADSSASEYQYGNENGKGKGKLCDIRLGTVTMLEEITATEPEWCPITDKDTHPFPIMELPTEIRLEIYRACLTRPYKILLSKRELPLLAKDDGDYLNPAISLDYEYGSDERDGAVQDRPVRIATASPVGSASTASTRRMFPQLRIVGATRGSRSHRTTSSATVSGSSSVAGTTATDVGSSNFQTGRSSTSSTGSRPASRPTRHVAIDSRRHATQPEPQRNQSQDPLITNVLRASKEIYKEARGVLYSENHFVLDLNTAMQTLGHLHQRSRRQIKHVELEIPTYNEILERFQETVRLSLRYCSGLKKFIINMPFTLPGADGSGTTGNTTVYANGFDILRWLPQECDIIVQGNICTEIETVVQKHLRLSKTLDKVRRYDLRYHSVEGHETRLAALGNSLHVHCVSLQFSFSSIAIQSHRNSADLLT